MQDILHSVTNPYIWPVGEK